MSVRIDIPIKVKLDMNAINNRMLDFDRLLSTALNRAFSKSYDEVVEKRGGYVNAIMNSPVFTYIGDAAINLRDDQRQALQEKINERINRASEASGVLEASHTNEDNALSSSKRPEEPIDETRFISLFNIYALPSYNSGGETELVDVLPQALVINRQYYALDLSYSHIVRNYQKAIEVIIPLYESAIERYGSPNTNEAGLLWQSGTNRFTFFIRNLQTNSWRAVDVDVQVFSLEQQGTAINWSQRPQGLPALIGSATYHNVSEAEAVHRKFHTSLIRKRYESVVTRPETMTREHYRSLLDQAVEMEIQRRTEAITSSSGIAGIVVIDFGVDVFICAVGISSEYAWQGKAILYPVLHDVEIPADQGETGKGNGGKKKGKGRRSKGGIVAGAGAAAGADGSLYPILPSQSGSRISCKSYRGEPLVGELGKQGEYIKSLMQEIATRLQISVCDYAGQFLLNAAQIIASRAEDIGDFAAANESNRPGFFSIAPQDGGNMGAVNFVPNASPAIQFIRFLAGTVPLVTHLSHILDRTYTIAEYSEKFTGYTQNDPYFWMLRFHSDLREKMELAVGTMFIMSCRVLMMQFLLTSKQAIIARLANFSNYAPLFEQLIVGEMAEIHELRTLQGRLTRQIDDEKGTRSTITEAGQGVMLTWNAARDGVSDLFSGYNPIEEDIVDQGFIKQGGKTVGIIDDDGRRWTVQHLDTALAIRQNTAESVDPLVKQIRDIPEILNRFRQNKNAIKTELRALLNEMLASNNAVRLNVINDRTFAFEASKIQKNIKSASISGTHYPLQGIHLQVHLQIGDFFRGDRYYALGINALFGRRLGTESLKEFFLFTGLTLLAVICAPLAVAVGAIVAIYEYDKAQQRLQLYRAFVEPEVVMSQAELEAELFAAELGLVLSFIPYAGRVLGTSTRIGKVVVRQGVRGSARVFARYGRVSRQQLGRSLTRQEARQVASSIRSRFSGHLVKLQEGFIEALVHELVEDQLLDLLLQKLLFGPALDRIYSDYRDYTPAMTGNTGTILPLPVEGGRNARITHGEKD